MAREPARTRSKSRKRRVQQRPATEQAQRAARNRRHDMTSRRRRRTSEDREAVRKIAATPRSKARGGRSRKDPNNPTRSKRIAPFIAQGKGGRPRSRRLRERKAA